MADRRNKTIRDMSITMGVLVVTVLAFVLINGGFTFGPGTSGGSVPSADAVGGFQREGSSAGFAAVAPHGLPASWQANSFTSTSQASATPTKPAAVRGGWVTDSGQFIGLVESAADAAATEVAELGAAGAPTGQIAAAGSQWTIVPGRRSEVAWVRAGPPGTTVLITGSASANDFLILAESIA